MTSTYAEQESLVQQAFTAYTANEFTITTAAARHFGAHYNRIKNYVNGRVSRTN